MQRKIKNPLQPTLTHEHIDASQFNMHLFIIYSIEKQKQKILSLSKNQTGAHRLLSTHIQEIYVKLFGFRDNSLLLVLFPTAASNTTSEGS